jgi:hypothetical protein
MKKKEEKKDEIFLAPDFGHLLRAGGPRGAA